jgi:hypothetical protein
LLQLLVVLLVPGWLPTAAVSPASVPSWELPNRPLLLLLLLLAA